MAIGTGLPPLKSGDVLSQPAAVIDGDKYSSAQAWGRIAAAGAQIEAAGEGLLKQELHRKRIGYQSDAENRAEQKKTELQVTFKDDPEGFKAAWQAHTEGTLSQAPTWAAADVQRNLNRVGNAAYSALLHRKVAVDDKLARESYTANLTTTEGEVVAAAMSGNLQSDEGKAAILKLQQQYAAGVSARFVSQEEADRQINAIVNRAQAESTIKTVGDSYRAARDRGDPDPALSATREAEALILRGDNRLSENERWAYFSKSRGEIRALEAERKQDLQIARLAATDMQRAMISGLRPDQQSVDQIVTELQRAGDHTGAARFLGSVARQEQNANFGRLPLGEMNRELVATEALSKIETTPFERRLIMRESSGNPAAVNKFGYAGWFQFGAPRLASIGLYQPGPGEDLRTWSKTPRNDPSKWSGTFSIPGFAEVKTVQQFLANPDAQRAAYMTHQTRMDAEISAGGLNRFEGQTVGGVPITRDGLRAMLHLGGVTNAAAFLSSGGSANVADAFRTSIGDYARLGVETGAVTAGPAVDPRLFADQRKATNTAAWTEWKKVSTDLDAGMRPTSDVLQGVINAARLTGDSDLLETIGDRLDRFDRKAAAGQQPVPVQEGMATELTRAGSAEGLPPGQKALLKDLKDVHAETVKGLENDPVSLTVKRFPERFSTPDPLDPSTSDSLRAGLRQRAMIADFAAKNFQVPALPALTPADVQTLQMTLERSDAATRVRVMGDLTAALPEGIRTATFAKMGSTGPAAMVQAFAGAMYAVDQKISESILRGSQAIKAEKRFNPTESNAKDFNTAMDKTMPPSVFSLAGRTNPSGPYPIYRSAIIARYADLAAQSGDTSGKLDETRLTAAVADVTGGVLERNGSKFIAPWRGMSQAQFDGIMWGLKDSDFAGVTTLAGEPLSADYVRKNAKLESYGDGRYLLRLNSDPLKQPVYAFRYANTESPQVFAMDLRNRQPANITYTRDGYPIAQ
jgi:hypothetical protein